MWKQRSATCCFAAIVTFFAISGFARNSSGTVEQEQVIQDIQEQIITFRKEFKQRIARADEDREAVFNNIHQKLDALNETQLSLNEQDPGLLLQLEAIQPELEKYGEQITALEELMAAMETTMQGRLDSIEAQLKAEKSGVASGSVPRRDSGTQHVESPEDENTNDDVDGGGSLNLSAGELFRLAYRFYTEGEYDVAIGGFQKFLIDFPEEQLAGPAQYWIAESFLKLEDYEIAQQEFERLIANYPRDNKVADAHYGIGVALMRLGNVAAARSKFQYVLDHFDGSIAAERARRRLEE